MAEEIEVREVKGAPEYLTREPIGRCSKCHRAAFDRSEFGAVCGFPQPSGEKCDGKFEPESFPAGQAEIIPQPEQTEIVKQPTRFWQSNGYKIIVGVVRRQVGFEVHEKPGKVIGQAVGLRNDGQSFFANVDLPWVWPKDYDWRPTALERLHTFLDPRCECRAVEVDTFVCAIHAKLNRDWKREDSRTEEAAKQQEKLLDRMPLTSDTPGPMTHLRLMHLDFPFIRQDVERNKWVCLICHAEHQAENQFSMYRNEFILKHTRCMEENKWDMDRRIKPDARTIAFREALEILNQFRYPGSGGLDGAYARLRSRLTEGADPEVYLEKKQLPETASDARVSEVKDWAP